MLTKTKDLMEAGMISLIAIFSPIQSALITVVVLIAIDMLTGILAARKKGEPVTSAGLRRTISKIFIYEVAVMIAFITEKYLAPDLLPIVKMASTMVAVVELKSVYENLNVLSGNELLRTLIDKIGSSNQS